MPALTASPGFRGCDRFAFHVHAAGVDAVDTEDRAAQFRSSGADQAGHPTISPARSCERDVVEHALAREPLDTQQLRSGRRQAARE